MTFRRPQLPKRQREEGEYASFVAKPRRAVMAVGLASLPPVVVEKEQRLESKAYRRYVASHACFACRTEGRSQAAHSNSWQHGKSRGRKADDRNLFPLCADSPFRVGCHTQHDQLIDMTLQDRREAEKLYVARMQARAVADGWNLETLKRTK